MPDAPELRRAFGRPSGQAEGCGSPTARWLLLSDVATGLLAKSLPRAGADPLPRPGRHEPRAVKRRPKNDRRTTKPRSELR